MSASRRVRMISEYIPYDGRLQLLKCNILGYHRRDVILVLKPYALLFPHALTTPFPVNKKNFHY